MCIRDRSTRQSLLGLGAFSYVDMQFVASDTLHNLLDLYITAELDKPWDSSLSAVFTTKSNNFIGPGLNLSPVSYTHLDVYKRQDGSDSDCP